MKLINAATKKTFLVPQNISGDCAPIEVAEITNDLQKLCARLNGEALRKIFQDRRHLAFYFYQEIVATVQSNTGEKIPLKSRRRNETPFYFIDGSMKGPEWHTAELKRLREKTNLSREENELKMFLNHWTDNGYSVITRTGRLQVANKEDTTVSTEGL